MVVVLDGGRGIRTGLERLLTAHGFRVRLHAEADRLFRDGLPTFPSCLLLDTELGSGMTGVEAHADLLRRHWFIPMVFLAGAWNVRLVVNAMRAGADGFLAKPFVPAEVVDAVALALQHSRDKQNDGFAAAGARSKIASLTHHEREIVRLVVAGLFNKEIADQLDLAVITVKVYRSRQPRTTDDERQRRDRGDLQQGAGPPLQAGPLPRTIRPGRAARGSGPGQADEPVPLPRPRLRRLPAGTLRHPRGTQVLPALPPRLALLVLLLRPPVRDPHHADPVPAAHHARQLVFRGPAPLQAEPRGDGQALPDDRLLRSVAHDGALLRSPGQSARL